MEPSTQEKSDSKSTLQEMGIKNPDQIIRYSLQQSGHNDELRIFYKRKKRSLLPNTRKYIFGRSANTIVSDSGTSQFSETHDISPFLQKAIAELDLIVKNSEDKEVTKQDILNEIEYLKSSMNDKIENLTELVSKC